jgi:hypothetical protein
VADELVQVGLLRPGHGERGQVVEVGLRAAVEGGLVPAACPLGVERLLVALQALEREALAQVLLQLGLLAARVERELRRVHPAKLAA